jgi:hypothetical protein
VQVRLILYTAVCLPCLHGSGADNRAACATSCSVGSGSESGSGYTLDENLTLFSLHASLTNATNLQEWRGSRQNLSRPITEQDDPRLDFYSILQRRLRDGSGKLSRAGLQVTQQSLWLLPGLAAVRSGTVVCVLRLRAKVAVGQLQGCASGALGSQ